MGEAKKKIPTKKLLKPLFLLLQIRLQCGATFQDTEGSTIQKHGCIKPLCSFIFTLLWSRKTPFDSDVWNTVCSLLHCLVVLSSV